MEAPCRVDRKVVAAWIWVDHPGHSDCKSAHDEVGRGGQMDSWRRHAVRPEDCTRRGERAKAHPWRRHAGWTGRWWLAAFGLPPAAIAGSPDGTRKPAGPTASPGVLQLLTALLTPLHASSQVQGVAPYQYSCLEQIKTTSFP